MVKCFKCEAEIRSAAGPDNKDDDRWTWDMPTGVLFDGGSNFGSTLYDSLFDGKYVQIVVCDDCVKAAQGTERLREVVNEEYRKKREEESEKAMERFLDRYPGKD